VHDPDPAGAGVEEREDGGASGGELTSRGQPDAYQRRRDFARRGLGSYLLVIASVAPLGIGCAHPPKPSSAEFFLARDTPVDSVRVATTEVAASRTIPVGEVEGVVVDGYWGAPIAGAQVAFRNKEDPGKSRGIITDANGHFHLTRLPHRPIAIRAQLIGYIADTAHIEGESGHFIRFGLRRQGIRACGLVIVTGTPPPPPFAISVYARDSRTNAAPRVPVTIRLRDGAFKESATVSPRDEPEDSLLVGAARGRDGVYDVEVTAPGYKPWYLKRVRPVVAACDEVLGRQFPAWLIPTT
jgi:hypothetical protein